MLFSLYNTLKWLIHGQTLKKIKLVVFDVDGVLTDGGIFVDDNNNIIRRFNVHDGLSIRHLKEISIKLAIISGGSGLSSKHRAQHLDISECLINVKDKAIALENLQNKLHISPENTAFIGDDLNDLVVRDRVGLLVAPADASIYLKRKCDVILFSKGGHGAIREFTEKLLISKGLLRKLYYQ